MQASTLSRSTTLMSFSELDLAYRARPVARRPRMTQSEALDLAVPADRPTAVLKNPAPAFHAASALVAANKTRAAAFAFDSLRRLSPSDYRAPAQYALLMQQLAYAQDAAQSIGRVYVTQSCEGAVDVACERLDHLEGMLKGFMDYLACLNDPVTSSRIAHNNGADAVTQGRIDCACSIVWAVMQAGALVNAMAGAVCAAVTHDGIVADLQAGRIDAGHPHVRAQLDAHFAALGWSHRERMRGELVVQSNVAATVGAWSAWRMAQCHRIYASIADVRMTLGDILPDHGDALALVDRLGSND